MNAASLARLLEVDELAEALGAVEQALARSLEVDVEAISGPARRVVLGGGKRLRPALTLASAVAAGGAVSASAVTGATAVELVQAGSLVHDDIMDEASERRGVPTINAVEGPSSAILVGDFLLARAGQLAASVSAPVAAALATAIADLCRGQSMESGTLYDAHRTVDAYERSIEGKTAALFRAACEIGALAAGGSPAAVAALSRFGVAFGMAFQIIDDVLDVVSTAEALGKPVGNDVREGVYSLPVLLALEGSGGGAIRARLGRSPSASDIDAVLSVVRSSSAVVDALARAGEWNRIATDALAALPATATRDGLASLPDAYLAWVLGEKAPGVAVSAGR
ncbi:MAG: polyprenyl synthetase family protein [Actinobacteria bacterium]|nr:polyprenyl synthetase family protein [Actinomycetota bacterium]